MACVILAFISFGYRHNRLNRTKKRLIQPEIDLGLDKGFGMHL